MNANKDNIPSPLDRASLVIRSTCGGPFQVIPQTGLTQKKAEKLLRSIPRTCSCVRCTPYLVAFPWKGHLSVDGTITWTYMLQPRKRYYVVSRQTLERALLRAGFAASDYVPLSLTTYMCARKYRLADFGEKRVIVQVEEYLDGRWGWGSIIPPLDAVPLETYTHTHTQEQSRYPLPRRTMK